MSAWAELVNANGSDEWLELCSRALEEVQRETSRKNAAKIRAHITDVITEHGIGYSDQGWFGAADLIDPEAGR